jgi:hypothetical protein
LVASEKMDETIPTQMSVKVQILPK